MREDEDIFDVFRKATIGILTDSPFDRDGEPPMARFVLEESPGTECPSCKQEVRSWMVACLRGRDNALPMRMLTPCGHIFDLPALKKAWVDGKEEGGK